MIDKVIEELKSEFPDFSIRRKEESLLMKFIAGFLKAVTFGSQKLFMTSYVTTIGHTVYVPDGWESWSDPSKLEIIRHERVHMRQQKRYGTLVYTFLYLFPFFPLFLAYGRARLEMEAYEETLRVKAELYGIDHIKNDSVHNWVVEQFTTGMYGWMWPFKNTVYSWVREAVDRISRSLS